MHAGMVCIQLLTVTEYTANDALLCEQSYNNWSLKQLHQHDHITPKH